MTTSRVSDGIDWYNVPVDEVFEKLGCSRVGLTSEAVTERLAIFGINKYQHKKKSFLLKTLCSMWSLRVAAAIIAIAVAWGKNLHWPVVVLVFLVLLIAPIMSYITEKDIYNHQNSVIAPLARKVKVLRDGWWSEEYSSQLVPGDVISINAGDIIPADARLLEGDDAAIIDEYVLTGVSSPVTKRAGDAVYSGCICEQGACEAVIIATGARTFFRKNVCLDFSINEVKCWVKVLVGIRNVCLCLVAVGVLVEIVFIYLFQHIAFWRGIDNLLVLLIGGIPIALHTNVLFVIYKNLHGLKGAILMRLTAIKDIAVMDVLCCDTKGTLVLNNLTVDMTMIEAFDKGVDADTVIAMAAQVCQTKTNDEIDAAILEMFFNSKEALNLACNKKDIEIRVHAVIDKFTQRGWHLQAVLYRVIIRPCSSVETCDSSLVDVHEIHTGSDQLAMAKEGGRHLGMGTNMYPVSSLLMESKDKTISASLFHDLIEKADGFTDITSGAKYEIIKQLQVRKRVCGVTGSVVTDVPALKKADIGIAVADATDAARKASDLVLTEPGLNVIIRAVLICRQISQKIKDYCIHIVSITVYTTLGFMLLAFIWKFNFPPIMMLQIVVFNEVLSCTYGTYRTRHSLMVPDHWGLPKIVKAGVALGVYLAFMTIFFFWIAFEKDFFQRVFGVTSLMEAAHSSDYRKLASAIYLQVSISIHGLVLVTQSRRWSNPVVDTCFLLMCLCVKLLATVIAVYADWSIIQGIGWGWAGVIWLYDIIFYVPLIVIRLYIHYAVSESASDRIKQSDWLSN
uniref:Cation-transporting P-type ATPase N-terminal domain-containing protein n=1 Tax=Chenopodium quinoa TaxID=63459 RepID=A0A803M5K2_CHEQI